MLNEPHPWHRTHAPWVQPQHFPPTFGEKGGVQRSGSPTSTASEPVLSSLLRSLLACLLQLLAPSEAIWALKLSAAPPAAAGRSGDGNPRTLPKAGVSHRAERDGRLFLDLTFWTEGNAAMSAPSCAFKRCVVWQVLLISFHMKAHA